MPPTMSLPSHSLFAIRSSRVAFYSRPTNPSPPPKIPNFSRPLSAENFANPIHSNPICWKFLAFKQSEPSRPRRSPVRVFESGGDVQAEKLRVGDQSLELFLSVAELICLVSSAALSIGLVLNWAMARLQKGFLGLLVDRVLVWQAVLLAGAVAIGAWIRRRQWRRISSSSLKNGAPEVNLVERIEKLEKDMQSSITVVRVLSRQLEKLGIRFRVTRKGLKEPIAETAALAQKNSEATRALAVQGDILEKELGEIQKVLMAMQEQQQKQLELILAIAKSGKLLENRQGLNREQETLKTYKLADGVEEMGPHQSQPVVTQKSVHIDLA